MRAQALRAGLDLAKLRFSLITALAACLALLVAWLLGLEHPQWSAMAVWAASQPIRGHLLEKSLARFGGTVIGAFYGMGLMWLAGGHPVVLVVGLALWVAACTFTGNIIRAFGSYAAMLSGYSASMVVLLDSAHPDHVFAIGIDRMLTAGVGVLAALAVGWFFAAPGEDDDEPIRRVQALTARTLAAIGSQLSQPAPARKDADALLRDMAGLEASLDLHGVGSLRRRDVVRRVRALLSPLVMGLQWLNSADHHGLSAQTKLPQALDAQSRDALDDRQTDRIFERLLSAVAPGEGLAVILQEMRSAYLALGREADPAGDAEPVFIYRDWIGARQAMVRAFVAMVTVGALWLLSGWQMGAFMLLGTSIMLTIFSTFEAPSAVLRFVFWGQVAGVAGALACRWLVWPWADSQFGLIVLMMPFILFGAFAMSLGRTQRIAFDYNMVMLLLLQPVWPQTMSFAFSLESGLAVIAGPAAGIVAYLLVYPTNSRRRYDAVRVSAVDDLERLAGSATDLRRSRAWTTLLHHRVLLMVHWSERAFGRREQATSDALCLLSITQSIRDLAERRRDASSSRTRRSIDVALRRMTKVSENPEKAADRLAALSRRLAATDPVVCGLLYGLGAQISAGSGWLRR